jgi:hypothetical protein
MGSGSATDSTMGTGSGTSTESTENQ